jgi:hypothetical protein
MHAAFSLFHGNFHAPPGSNFRGWIITTKDNDWARLTGWWFGTCFIFPYVGNVIIPTDELHHFSEG